MSSNETNPPHSSTNNIDQDQIISSFLEIAIGHTVETAKKILQLTDWNLEVAINLFLMNDLDLVSITTSSDLFSPPRNLLFKGSFQSAKTIAIEKNLWLLVNLQSRTEFACDTLNRDIWSNDSVSKTVECGFMLWQVYDHTVEGQKVKTFYKIESFPPVVLLIDPITGQKMCMWSGEFEPHSFLEDLIKYTDAGPCKDIAGSHGHVAVVASPTRNKQPERKLTCWSRNRNWAEVFEEKDLTDDQSVVASCDAKEETCSSSSNIDQASATNLTDQVVTYSPINNNDHNVSPSLGSEQEETKEETCSSSNNIDQAVVAPFCDEESTKTSFPSNNNDHIEAPPSLGLEQEEPKEVEKEKEETCFDFPVLTEEPKEDCDRSLVCTLCIRFPDGRRKQRRFLKTEPVQFLWSFCYSLMEESERKVFKLVHAIPGASKTLVYEDNMTFAQSGLASSMIYVTWE
ncbi:unnamed protein product [Cochlearia groenlandica]